MPLIQWILQNKGAPAAEGYDEGSELPVTVGRRSSSAIAATLLAASLGCANQWVEDDFPAPQPTPIADEDSAPVVAPSVVSLARLYLPDAGDDFVSQVDESDWQQYIPPPLRWSALLTAADDDLPVTPAASLEVENYAQVWPQQVAPRLPVIVSDDDIPAGSLYGQPDEDYETRRPVQAPWSTVPAYLPDTDEVLSFLTVDEETSPVAVPRQSATLALYQPDPDDFASVVAVSATSDDDPAVVQLLSVYPSRALYLPDAQDEVTTPAPPLPFDEEQWLPPPQYPVPPAPAVVAYEDEAQLVGPPPGPDVPLGAGDSYEAEQVHGGDWFDSWTNTETARGRLKGHASALDDWNTAEAANLSATLTGSASDAYETTEDPAGSAFTSSSGFDEYQTAERFRVRDRLETDESAVGGLPSSADGLDEYQHHDEAASSALFSSSTSDVWRHGFRVTTNIKTRLASASDGTEWGDAIDFSMALDKAARWPGFTLRRSKNTAKK